jgi:class 3 adenylate cyclase/tetratricopeptide (TPR) repeat protein
MDFDEILAQVLPLLQHAGRISYSALKLRFTLDDAHLEALKDELIEAKRCAIDEHGKVLVWTGAPAVTPSPETGLSPPEAERRQLTVMFCDLVDSTALAERLDPEDLREVMLAYRAACAEVIQRFDGHIAQYLGDGLLVYYGYPHAHEDDPQRAVRTGLGIVKTIRQLSRRQEQERGVHLACRIGIHTGLAVVGGGNEWDGQLAWGETLNLAARLQAVAQPNTVVIMASTYGLIRGYFVCRDQGTHLLKGIAAPVHVYQVVQESGARSRFDVAVTSGLTPLVDREEELHRLWQYWEQSRAGQGQVVLLSGEAGVGKSRLVEALRVRLGYQPYTYMAFRCSPYHTHSAFYAVTDYLQRRLQWRHDESSTVQREKLERLLHACGLPLEESMLLFTTLLSLPSGTDSTPLQNPQQQRQKTQEALVAWLMWEARQQSVLAVWEDLHWADPSTLELLSLVSERTRAARLLTLLTCRPEFCPPPADSLAPLHLLTLGRLERQWVEQMVTHLTHGKALPHEVLQQVLAKTDGVPLFVEELVKMVLESGLLREEAEHYALTGPLPPLAVPATLQDSLMARLDRLGMAREVAQVGATLGREFSYELIQAVVPLEEQILQHGLAQLVDAELIYQDGVPPQSRYLFKHALIQEAAYQSLLRHRRRHFHQRIAEVLTSRFPETVMTQPELLAHHYTAAGLSAQAVPYWQQAGQRAIERSANKEAISHLTKGLEVLATLPSTPGRVQQELALQLMLGSALYMTRGHTVAEVERAYTRAYELCLQGGDVTQHFSVMTGLWRLYASQAQFQTAYEWAKQCVDLAQHAHNPLLLQEARLVLGSTLFFLGDFVPAHEHLEQGIALYSPQYSQALTYSLGTNSRVECLARDAWTLWLLGYPDQALVRSQEALALAQELSHVYSLALALCHAAVLHVWRLEAQAALAQSEALMALASEQGLERWLAGGMCTRGWALAALERVEEGIAQLRQGLAVRGHSVGQTHNHAMLAEVYGKTGQIDAGLRILDELMPGHTSAEQHYAAEVYRLQGELMLQQGQEAEAVEARFCRALDTARQQRTKILELRAAMSLSRLWQRQEKRAEARRLLSKISGWFTEGFATADLQAARTLLETLT